MINSRRALIGVGVLIIFLSTILAASITAGVLIRTSGVLVQKSTDVERTVRERLVTGFEMVSAQAQGNTTTEKINNFEFFVRLRAGSSAIQLGDTFFTFASDSYTGTADIQDPYTYYLTTQILFLNTSNSTSITDLDDDGVADSVIVMENYQGSLLDYLNFSLSLVGNAIVELEADISAATTNNSVSIYVPDSAIVVNDTIYGYVHIRGSTTTNGTLQDPIVFYVSPLSFQCKFTTLTEETKYCAYAFVGDENTVLDAGELLGIRYKVRNAYALGPGEELEVQLVPKEGDLMRMDIKMPNLVKPSIRLL